jgi:putative ABC transport system ATP-binding protein
MAIFQRLNTESGITIVLVTHESDIATYAGRVLSFKDGRLLRDEAVERPRTALQELQQRQADEAE